MKKLIFTLAFSVFSLMLFSQQIIGRGITYKTNAHPDSIASLANPNVVSGPVMVVDTTTSILYSYNFQDSTWVVPDTRPYNTFVALLTQSGTDDPVLTVLENTFGGDFVASRDDAGDYRITYPAGVNADNLILIPNIGYTAGWITYYSGAEVFTSMTKSFGRLDIATYTYPGFVQSDNLIDEITIVIREYK